MVYIERRGSQKNTSNTEYAHWNVTAIFQTVLNKHTWEDTSSQVF